MFVITIKNKIKLGRGEGVMVGMVTRPYNSCYLGGRGRRISSFSETLSLNKIEIKGLETQGPEFNP
jgi:hypothetical protein